MTNIPIESSAVQLLKLRATTRLLAANTTVFSLVLVVSMLVAFPLCTLGSATLAILLVPVASLAVLTCGLAYALYRANCQRRNVIRALSATQASRLSNFIEPAFATKQAPFWILITLSPIIGASILYFAVACFTPQLYAHIASAYMTMIVLTPVLTVFAIIFSIYVFNIVLACHELSRAQALHTKPVLFQIMQREELLDEIR